MFAEGDEVVLVGTPEEVDKAVAGLGVPAATQLQLDRSDYDFRRIFVSNHDIAGRRISDLDLPRKYGAVISRVRRGDIDLLAHGDTVLELGDRVRVVSRTGDMQRISALFGDSYKALSEVNLLSLSLALAAGVLIGLIPIPLPGGVRITLGMAGGPLLVGLVLGAIRRTRGIVWTIPYSANLTLRQIGLSILLAGIGIRSGYTFLTSFTASGGLQHRPLRLGGALRRDPAPRRRGDGSGVGLPTAAARACHRSGSGDRKPTSSAPRWSAR